MQRGNPDDQPKQTPTEMTAEIVLLARPYSAALLTESNKQALHKIIQKPEMKEYNTANNHTFLAEIASNFTDDVLQSASDWLIKVSQQGLNAAQSGFLIASAARLNGLDARSIVLAFRKIIDFTAKRKQQNQPVQQIECDILCKNPKKIDGMTEALSLLAADGKGEIPAEDLKFLNYSFQTTQDALKTATALVKLKHAEKATPENRERLSSFLKYHTYMLPPPNEMKEEDVRFLIDYPHFDSPDCDYSRADVYLHHSLVEEKLDTSANRQFLIDVMKVAQAPLGDRWKNIKYYLCCWLIDVHKTELDVQTVCQHMLQSIRRSETPEEDIDNITKKFFKLVDRRAEEKLPPLTTADYCLCLSVDPGYREPLDKVLIALKKANVDAPENREYLVDEIKKIAPHADTVVRACDYLREAKGVSMMIDDFKLLVEDPEKAYDLAVELAKLKKTGKTLPLATPGASLAARTAQGGVAGTAAEERQQQSASSTSSSSPVRSPERKSH